MVGGTLDKKIPYTLVLTTSNEVGLEYTTTQDATRGFQ